MMKLLLDRQVVIKLMLNVEKISAPPSIGHQTLLLGYCTKPLLKYKIG